MTVYALLTAGSHDPEDINLKSYINPDHVIGIFAVPDAPTVSRLLFTGLEEPLAFLGSPEEIRDRLQYGL